VLNTAARIVHDIQATSPSNFDPTMFSIEVESVLATISKFEGMGVDYLPAVKGVRSALDEPVGGQIMKFNCSSVLDSWIEEHS
jgi:hypothetical protein